MLHDTPKQPRRSGRQLRHFAQLGRLAVRAEWRRGVGRQARQSGGSILLFHKHFFKTCILKRVQVRCTCLVLPFHFLEDCRTAPLFDSPEKERTMKASLALAAVIAASLLSSSAAWAQGMPGCRIKTCEEGLRNCIAFRTSRQISPSELTCEASAAKCRSTGIWSGKYTRGTPEVRDCKIGGQAPAQPTCSEGYQSCARETRDSSICAARKADCLATGCWRGGRVNACGYVRR
jgi:hypothetical protein